MSDAVLTAQTDICVKCGLCLPHCPTYLKTRDENESPRGRLSLIQGWARDELPATPRLTAHVDNCLLCRACESVCPAYVPYGQIVDRFRAATREQASAVPLARRLKKSAMELALTNSTLAPAAGRLMTGSLAGGLKSLANLVGAGELTAGLPAPAQALPLPGLHAPEGLSRGTLSLFLGCTADLADRETAGSALRLLNRLGYAVDIPAGQTCCGALRQHAGEAEAAAEQMRRNLEHFDAHHPILSFASGCGVMLREYDRDEPSESRRAFSRQVRDTSQFLAEQDWPEDFVLEPLKQTVCLHSPCSLKNVLRADRHAASLLRRIPDLKLATLPASIRCCGAAGSYMIDHPDMAQALRDDALDAIAATQPAALLTSNPGCALHLRAGLRSRGVDVEVLHPITLLARQMRPQP